MEVGLLKNARRLRVAFSGGCDSTVLLAELCRLRALGEVCAEITAVHVHHGLQDSADSWEAHCRQQCRRLDVPLRVLRVQVPEAGPSTENKARKARYRAWEALLSEGDVLVLAHHADDQAETVLMRLLRGAGTAGMAGMPAARPLGAGMLARPLLDVSRDEIRRYARHNRLQWVEDPSNANPVHDRNFIRHKVLPLLRQKWPGAVSSIRRSADIARRTDALCRELATEDLSAACDAGGHLSVNVLLSLPVNRRILLMNLWCRHLDVSPPPARRMASLQDMLSAAPDRSPQIGWSDGDGNTMAIRRYRSHLYLVRIRHSQPLPRVVRWDHVRQPRLLLPHGELSISEGQGGMHPDRLKGLEVRFRRGGEILRQAGRGCTRPLRKYLQEMGVPPWLRQGLPLLYAGEQLAAVSDICICEGFAAPAGGAGLHVHWNYRG